MANKIPVKARYTGSDVTSLGEFESGDLIPSTYLDTGTTSGKLLLLDGSAKIPAVDGSLLTGIDSLPTQTSHSGKYLGTDGTNATWNSLNTDANTTTKAMYENSDTVSSNYTISTGNHAMSSGPITINTGITVTVPTGSNWVIL
jgi:hypothetical protein